MYRFFDRARDTIKTGLAGVALICVIILAFVVGISIMLLNWKHEVENLAFRKGYASAVRDAVAGGGDFYDKIVYNGQVFSDDQRSEFRMATLRDHVIAKLHEDIFYTIKFSQDERIISKGLREIVKSNIAGDVQFVAREMKEKEEISEAVYRFVTEDKEPIPCPAYGFLPLESAREVGSRKAYELAAAAVPILDLWNQNIPEVSIYIVLNNGINVGIRNEDLARRYSSEIKKELEYIADGMEHDIRNYGIWLGGWLERYREDIRRVGNVQGWYPSVPILEGVRKEVGRIEDAVKERDRRLAQYY